MTPLDWFNALLIGSWSLYSFFIGLGIAAFVVLVPVLFVIGLVRFFVWPGLCAFGNWFGRP